MRAAILAATAVTTLLGVIPARAEVNYPFCLIMVGRDASENCGFTSFEQCRATQSGQGGYCMQNPRYAYVGEEPRRRRHPRR